MGQGEEKAYQRPLYLERMALSGCGWLLSYHVGVWSALKEMGVVDDETEFAGASGGSLVATAICCGFTPNDIMRSVFELADWYRSPEGGFGRLENEMRIRFNDMLPTDAHERVSGRLHITVLPVHPKNRFTQRMVSKFDSAQDLVEAALTSSFIPLYLAPSLAKSFRNEWCIDGGIGNAVPSFKDATSVCPLPGSGVGASPYHPARLIASDVDITPDLVQDSGLPIPSYPQILGKAIVPAPEEV